MTDEKIPHDIVKFQINEWSLVPKGANQWADVELVKENDMEGEGKNLCKSCGKPKDGETGKCTRCSKKKGMGARILKFFGISDPEPEAPVVKEEPEAPALVTERMAMTTFWEGWDKLRNSYQSSLSAIEYGDFPNRIELIREATNQFLEQLEQLSEKVDDVMMEKFFDMQFADADDLNKALDTFESTHRTPNAAEVEMSKEVELAKAAAEAKVVELQKAYDEAQAKLEAIAKEQAIAKEKELEKQFEDEAGSIGLNVDKALLGKALRKLSEVDAELHKGVVAGLRGAATQVKAASAVLGNTVGSNAAGSVDKLASRVEALRKEKGLTEEQAYAQIYKEDPAAMQEAMGYQSTSEQE